MGIKNGKAYFIMDEHPKKERSNRNPGAQIGHRGHFRRIPKITERVTLKTSEFSCPICSSPLVRKGIRRRVIEDIPPIVPSVIEYKIERMYCRHCRKTFEPDVPNTLPGARLSLRTMLITAYPKIGIRMSIETVSTTMKEMFGVYVSEGEVQDILYQLSDALGKEYLSLLDDIRRAPSQHTYKRIMGESKGVRVLSSIFQPFIRFQWNLPSPRVLTISACTVCDSS